jgi:hypothetical protein
MKRIRKRWAGTIWIDGIAQPAQEARLEIVVADKSRDAASPTVAYSIMVVVDETSGEDGTACPMCESLPVPSVCGGRHPSIAELGELTIADGDDWNAWFGTDAPRLSENHLRFDGWIDPTRLRCTWTARYAQPHETRLLQHRTGPEPGTMKFEGEAHFLSIRTSADSPEEADRLVASIWGEQQLAALERRVGRSYPAYELHPDIQRWLPKSWGRWLPGFIFFHPLRRRLVPVSYHPKP